MSERAEWIHINGVPYPKIGATEVPEKCLFVRIDEYPDTMTGVFTEGLKEFKGILPMGLEGIMDATMPTLITA